MEKEENNFPSIDEHNSFAKIIKNLFHDDLFSANLRTESSVNVGMKE